MSEILWTKNIPLDNIDQKDGLVADETSTVPQPFFNYEVKKLYLQCVKDVEFVENPHGGHEVTTIKLEVKIDTGITLLIQNIPFRALFWVDIYYQSGKQVDNYATPSGQTFLGGSFGAGSKTLTARADNVKNYSSIIKGDLADKVRLNFSAKIVPQLQNDDMG